MQATCLLALGIVVLSSCTPVSEPGGGSSGSTSLTLSSHDKSLIGRKIWQNECAGTIDGLTMWNFGEEFPSFGIGHFIWYPVGVTGPFKESWPEFVSYAQQHGASLPALALQQGCPWANKRTFHQAFRDPQLQELRDWLAAHVDIQTDFIVARSQAALPQILAAAPSGSRSKIQANYNKVASSPQGVYALIDYVNFKGDGTLATERYQEQGWGLLQVLDDMQPVATGPAAATEFSAAAKRMLARRIANSPPARGESRWLPGWNNRCDSYAKGL
jgi:hypothetical protein